MKNRLRASQSGGPRFRSAALRHAWMTLWFAGACVVCAQENGAASGAPPSVDVAGPLFIIGGASKPKEMLERLRDVAGGRTARIVVVPAASRDPELAGQLFVEQMEEVGAQSLVVTARTREEALTPFAVEQVASADAVYFTGGDQNRLHDVLSETEFLESVRALHRRGGVMAGTSAGAAIMGPLMLTGEEADVPEGEDHFARLRPDVIETREGFGFWPEAVVDQHFLARRRNNRLLSVVLDRPELLGIGIDESTAVVVREGALEVVGVGNVVVYDARGAEVPADGVGDLHRARGVVVHVLGPGERWWFREIPE